ASPPIVASRRGRVVAGPVLDELDPAVGGAVDHGERLEWERRPARVQPGEQLIPGRFHAHILRLVDNLAARSEGQGNYTAPPAMWVGERRLHGCDQAEWLRAAEGMLEGGSVHR